jgi:hypothetical protein
MKVKNQNLKNNYMENLLLKINSTPRLNQLKKWIVDNEEIRNVYYKNNKCIKKCYLSGGIIIENNNNWIKIFNNLYDKSLLVYDKIDNNYINYKNIICIQVNDINNIYKNEIWKRIIFDITDISIMTKNKDIFNLLSKNRWIHINNWNDNDVLNYLKIILNDDKINIPLYQTDKINKYEFFNENTTYVTKINELITINKIKYNLRDYDKIILKYYEYDILESIKLYSLINKQNIPLLDIDCSICLNNINNNICYTECCHHFCIECLFKWLSNNINCPYCRKKVNIKKILINNVLTEIDDKTNILFNRINNLLNINKKILIYSSNEYYYQYINTLFKNNLIEEYNKYNKNIQFINNNIGCLFIKPNDNDFIITIKDISNIIIIDNNYKNIIKRESFGYDLIYKNKSIELDIIELNE